MISPKSIVFITCYFGHWPPWINFFFETCKFNPSVDFLLFTDCDIPEAEAGNLKFIPFSLEKFNLLASEKLALKIALTNPYKICDFKPAFGALFQDHIHLYDFWGHLDVDLVLGDIREFITHDLLSKYELLAPRKEYVPGHFTLYKNCNKVNQLYRKSRDYKKIFTTPDQYFCFDECNFQWFELLKGKPIDQLNCDITSMTHIAKSLAEQELLKAYFETHILEEDTIDSDGNLITFNNMLAWENGRLRNLSDGKEYLYFHFHFLKKRQHFIIPSWKKIPSRFCISRNGFYEPPEDTVIGNFAG